MVLRFPQPPPSCPKSYALFCCLQALARDFMVKTRRRKGMTDDVRLAPAAIAHAASQPAALPACGPAMPLHLTGVALPLIGRPLSCALPLLNRRCPSTSSLTIPCSLSWHGRMPSCSRYCDAGGGAEEIPGGLAGGTSLWTGPAMRRDSSSSHSHCACLLGAEPWGWAPWLLSRHTHTQVKMNE